MLLLWIQEFTAGELHIAGVGTCGKEVREELRRRFFGSSLINCHQECICNEKPESRRCCLRLKSILN